MTADLQIFRGEVFHARMTPRSHRFCLRVFALFFDIRLLDKTHSLGWKFFGLPLLGINRKGFLSLNKKDFGLRNENFLSHSVFHFSSKNGDRLNEVDAIYLLTFPRVFGYVFNPVSFYFGTKNSQLKFVLCEVNNTFSESHNYLIWNKDLSSLQANQWFSAKKNFFVSPFFPVTGSYRFRFLTPFQKMAQNDKTLRVDIVYSTSQNLNEEPLSEAPFKSSPDFVSYISGSLSEFSPRALSLSWARHLFLTFKIIGLIHIHALFLLLKKIPLQKKTAPPHHSTTSS